MIGIKREWNKHAWAYVILLFSLTAFILLFLGAWPNVVAQRFMILGMGLFYWLWGMVVHRHEDDFSKKVAGEYLAVAALSAIILLLLTW